MFSLGINLLFTWTLFKNAAIAAETTEVKVLVLISRTTLAWDFDRWQLSLNFTFDPDLIADNDPSLG